MHIFFMGLGSICLGLLVPTLWFQYVSHEPLTHFYFGLIATVACLITHCWVFFYFIGTGQGIREGILAHRLDTSHIKTTKKFKGKTFPFALFSMIFMIVTATTGGAVRFDDLSPLTHAIWALVAILFNVFSFWQEYRIIQKNRSLMKELNEHIEVHSS